MYATEMNNLAVVGRMTTDSPKAASSLDLLHMQAGNASERAEALLSRLREIRIGLTGEAPPAAVTTKNAKLDGGSLGVLRTDISSILETLEECHNVLSDIETHVP